MIKVACAGAVGSGLARCRNRQGSCSAHVGEFTRVPKTAVVIVRRPALSYDDVGKLEGMGVEKRAPVDTNVVAEAQARALGRSATRYQRGPKKDGGSPVFEWQSIDPHEAKPIIDVRPLITDLEADGYVLTAFYMQIGSQPNLLAEYSNVPGAEKIQVSQLAMYILTRPRDDFVRVWANGLDPDRGVAVSTVNLVGENIDPDETEVALRWSNGLFALEEKEAVAQPQAEPAVTAEQLADAVVAQINPDEAAAKEEEDRRYAGIPT